MRDISARELKGHNILAVERYWDNTRWMIEFSVLRPSTALADAYKVSGDSFYMQDGKAVLPLGTLTVEETKAPNGYLLDGAYMQVGDKSEQIKGLYVTQITEDGDLAVLSGSNQFSVSDKQALFLSLSGTA